MIRTGISRRHFVVTLITALGASACTSIPVPKMGDGPPRVGVKSAIRMGPSPIKQSDAKFAFVKISGAPSTHVIEFSRALDREAKARNLIIVPEDDPSATYLVKGYLSAIGDKSGTILVFVWDVTDTSGRRVHRVSGQESGGGSSNDPWSGVDTEAVETAARRTIDNLVAWVS